MAEISIPLSVKLGDLSALSSLQRQVDDTKRKLTSLGDFEEVPGGGIRRRGDTRAQPGAGTYAPPSMGPNAPFRPSSVSAPTSTPASRPPATPTPGQPFVQAVPQVQAYRQALNQTTQQARTLTDTLQQTGRAATLVSTSTQPRTLSGRAAELFGRTIPGAPPPPPPVVLTVAPAASPEARPPIFAPAAGPLPPRRPPIPPPGPPPGGESDDEAAPPGRFRQAVQRGFQAVQPGLQRAQGVARGALGIAAGVGVYQTLTHAMTLYEQRAAGVIATGMQLDLQFDRVGGTIDSLRSKYQVLAHDSIQAMQAMGRISGDMSAQSLARLDRSVRFGTAYGMAPAQAAMMAEHLQRTTVAGPNPLATIAATTRLLGTGITPMSTEARAEEVFSMAQRGAASGLRVPLSQYSREANLIGSMGEQYQVPGAVSQFAGQLSQGLTQSPDIGVYAMRMQALSQMRRERQARGEGTTLTHGGHRFDLTSNFDLGALMEVADQVPEVQEAYRQSAIRNAGGNREVEKYLFKDLVSGDQLNRVQSENLRATLGRTPGGFNAQNAPATAETAAEERRVGGRLAARAAQPEFLHQAVTAQVEGGLEQIGKRMVTFGDEIKKGVADIAIAASEGRASLTELGNAMKMLSSQSLILMGVLTSLSAQTTVGQIAGAAMTALGSAEMGIYGGRTPGQAGPPLHFGVPAPSLQPQRPGP